MKTRIMYIESKGESLTGPARIGRVTFSKTGATLRYAGREFQSLKGHGFKANYFGMETPRTPTQSHRPRIMTRGGAGAMRTPRTHGSRSLAP